MTRISPVATLIVIALVAAGCGDDGTSATTAADGPTTTTAPGTTVPAATGGPGPPVSLDDPGLWREPEGLSYRFTQEFRVAVPGGAYAPAMVGRSFVDGGKLLGPPEQTSLTLRLEPHGGEAECRPLHEVDGFRDPYHLILDASGILTGEALLSEEGLTVAGRTVDRYVFGIDAIKDTQTIDEVSIGYLDLDRDDGFVVQIHLEGRGRSSLAGEGATVGAIELTVLVSEFGTVAELTAPAGC